MNAFFESIQYASWGLHFLLWYPVVAMFVILFAKEDAAKKIALFAATVEFIVSLPLWFLFQDASAQMQFASVTPWIPQWGISYRIGLDGITILLVLLSTFLWPLTILGSFKYI